MSNLNSCSKKEKKRVKNEMYASLILFRNKSSKLIILQPAYVKFIFRKALHLILLCAPSVKLMDAVEQNKSFTIIYYFRMIKVHAVLKDKGMEILLFLFTLIMPLQSHTCC